MIALLRWISLRHLIQERGRAFLTIAGVALGVAVFVAVRLASHSALASFSDTVDSVAGRANLQIAGSTEGLDERLFPEVRRAPGVEAAAPIVQQYAIGRAWGRESRRPSTFDETLLILGVDLFLEPPFQRYQAGFDDSTDLRGAWLAFLADPRAAAVTRAYATRHALAPGDTIEIVSSGVPAPLVVRLILDSESFQQAFGGNVLVVDISTAQELFHRAGRLDRIDLLVGRERMEEARDAIAPILPSDVEISTPAGRTRQVEGMVSAFSLNLTALSFVALFVATFLIFNAVSMAVVRRRREIGMLRALGQTRRETMTQFILEGLALGSVGGGLGLVLGTLMARGALSAVSRTLSDLYLVTHADRLRADPTTYLIGISLGVVSALASAVIPAIEASRTPPATTLRQGSFIEAGHAPIRLWTAAGLLLLAIAAGAAWWTVTKGRPWGGFASAFLVLVGFSLLAPVFTLFMESAAAPAMRRLFGIAGVLGTRYLRDAVARTSVVVAALMVSVGMMVALDVMVGSFRRTVDTWVRQTIRGDLYVEPVGRRVQESVTALPPELLERVRAIPGVDAVDTYRGARIVHRGSIATAVGVDFGVQIDHGRLRLESGDARAALQRALREDGVLVTESFAHRHQIRTMDRLQLATPAGAMSLPVFGVLIDYSSDAGAIYMDRALYARLWLDDRIESFALYLEAEVDPEEVARAVTQAAGPERMLAVTPNQTLRERVLAVFDQTFRITYALRTIAVLVALLGVAATLTALVLQRGREVGILRASGALRSQVRTMVLAESALLGLIGAILGSVAGIVLSLVLVHIINRQYFGWTIAMSLEPAVFARALFLMVGASLLAGLLPARIAAGRLTAEALRSE